MSFIKIVSELDSYLESSGKRKEALKSLLVNGRISQSTFDKMDAKISHLTSLVSDLKTTLESEETFWKTSLPESIMILESLLVELELKHFLNEISMEEWEQKRKIIISGLDALKNKSIPFSKAEPSPVQTTLEEQATVKIDSSLIPETKVESSRSSSKSRKEPKYVAEEDDVIDTPPINRHKRHITKEPPDLEKTSVSKTHCMNPWKPECRDTDIELSIYYNGRMTPICRSCWEDISKKNIEWSSL